MASFRKVSESIQSRFAERGRLRRFSLSREFREEVMRAPSSWSPAPRGVRPRLIVDTTAILGRPAASRAVTELVRFSRTEKVVAATVAGSRGVPASKSGRKSFPPAQTKARSLVLAR